MVSPFLQSLKGDLFPGATKELSLSTAVLEIKLGMHLVTKKPALIYLPIRLSSEAGNLHHRGVQGARQVSKTCSRTPLMRKLVIGIANYPDRLGLSGKFVKNSTKVTCLEIISYRITYNTVLWFLELEISRGRKI
jgi:hypothetical protein